MPNPRATRALGILSWYPYLHWLRVPNPDYTPPTREEGAVAFGAKAEPTKETEPDYYSWFMDESEHHQLMPKESANLRRHRWLLCRCAWLRQKQDPTAPVDISQMDWMAEKTVINKRKGNDDEDKTTVPKSEYKIDNATREKIIIWFTHKVTLELFREILCAIPFFNRRQANKRIASLTADTTAAHRDRIQAQMNNLDDELTVLLASNLVGAVGLNFQKDVRVQIHGDLAQTYDREVQAKGRSYRLGQLPDVIVYSFVVLGSMDMALIE
ncbi:hypothetical protein BDW02DRAFT_597321 [Decorospora gaudefroyi]|uniref:Helicase C-terminal domain-containing protein n=1 Tax=Decorospora gaudefroyi TaxID=184978 RepID=A0A6A5KM56_9PLEO|nr:hypothetical protein BDW02DRAFT_597321 [Decorospora gaudefroyi]